MIFRICFFLRAKHFETCCAVFCCSSLLGLGLKMISTVLWYLFTFWFWIDIANFLRQSLTSDHQNKLKSEKLQKWSLEGLSFSSTFQCPPMDLKGLQTVSLTASVNNLEILSRFKSSDRDSNSGTMTVVPTLTNQPQSEMNGCCEY